ncbi:MAG: DUF1858 domain-containing protein [Desulfuromonadales bacterium]|nr:DUF1858 domain-containing protein [Desulfuromonadales bacterium]NIS40661.1 DUF1858 domain-containing protein [Desulfuromonadales bacterium]
MAQEKISPDMRVWDVIQEHPETVDVFRRHGCPDMRKGIYALSAHVMKVKWAAKVHHIDQDTLLRDLNRTIAEEGDKTVH